MKSVHIVLAALFAAGVSAGVGAQQAAPAAASAAAVKDCKRQIPRHDHGAERGVPSSKAWVSGCPPEPAASAAATRKPKPGHDHAKTHKNQ